MLMTLFCSFGDILCEMISICFLSAGLLKRIMYWAFRLISVLYFPFGNAFWSIRITLALRWRPWVKSFDTMVLSFAWSIRSSKTRIWLNLMSISLRSSSLYSGKPCTKRIHLPSFAHLRIKDLLNLANRGGNLKSTILRKCLNILSYECWLKRSTI